jgi:hypothetical protein
MALVRLGLSALGVARVVEKELAFSVVRTGPGVLPGAMCILYRGVGVVLPLFVS